MVTMIATETFTPISKIRSRNQVLKHLLPKIFGIISERGQRLEAYPGCSASLDGELTLSGCHLGADRIMLSAYCPLKFQITKVFSAHVTDLPNLGDPNFYRFWDGHVGLMSWRRGVWEDAVMDHAARPLSLSEAFLRGIFRTENQVPH